MADNISLINCPADCATDNVWPAIPAEQDCASYNQTLSQVSDLIIIPEGASDVFDDWNGDYPTQAYANGTIDNTTADNSTAHILTGIGGVAEPAELILDYPKLQQVVVERTYTLTHRIVNLSNTMYDFLLKMQCGDLGFTFYYCDLGGFTYGIEGGLVPYSVDVDMPKGGGNDDRSFADIIITWKAAGDPDRSTTPANLGVNV
jgi:hypothetical protein